MRHTNIQIAYFIFSFLFMTPLSWSQIPNRGGSSYGIITAGEFIEKQTDASWYGPQGVKSVIGNFHRFPERALSQMQQLRASGQEKIALMLWVIPSGSQTGDEFGHTLRISTAGTLRPQHAENLKAVLNETVRLRFKTVIIRYANQADCDPSGWKTWNEKQFLENLNFVVSTRELVESTVLNSPIEVLYDLAGEQPGGGGQADLYVRNLWTAWVQKFGNARSTFSIAWAPLRLRNMIQDFKSQKLPLPEFYALDIYGDELNASKTALWELKWHGENKKPVVIMESFLNDEQAAQAYLEARDSWGLNITTILQWPLARNSGKKHFSQDLPDSYSRYLKVIDTPRAD